ncbi:MAG: hypothetical protein KKE44_10150 [Proteobacteria bacterium]|nr:hypothetical protein [Pseudomonadota bacterium]MBU1583084.1 hypothetical protein [Pseudomonadota bacterium]MBU2455213.1 hypothetical protein [Pseudomonadota bacterium]MBU2630477.1 hypothetical protein [Pseudomonadota bacterium]
MDLDTPETKAYLFELYTMTGGDTQAQVSMYDVGESLGMGKTDAASMAEDLYIQGFAELKTLSGGIGITDQGLEVLEITVAPKPDASLRLGTGPVLDDQAKKAVEKIVQDIKAGIDQTRLTYPQLEELVMDIKTIEIQMQSPTPKTAIIREVLKSLHNGMLASGPKDLIANLYGLMMS